MSIPKTGVILLTKKYEECVQFYAKIIGLKKILVKEDLSCFAFGDSYLMVELGGSAEPKGKSPEQNPCIFRINVEDVKERQSFLSANGIDASYTEYSWGTVCKFTDPDGNYWEYRDSQLFNEDITNYLKTLDE